MEENGCLCHCPTRAGRHHVITALQHFTGGNRTMVAAATIVIMAAADGERIQYFRWCALTKLAVSHFLHQIYSPSKEEVLQSLLMSLSTLVFWLFDEENIRRHDGCSKWWRWLQLMFRERWRGLHDSFVELVPLITQEICFIFET